MESTIEFTVTTDHLDAAEAAVHRDDYINVTGCLVAQAAHELINPEARVNYHDVHWTNAEGEPVSYAHNAKDLIGAFDTNQFSRIRAMLPFTVKATLRHQ